MPHARLVAAVRQSTASLLGDSQHTLWISSRHVQYQGAICGDQYEFCIVVEPIDGAFAAMLAGVPNTRVIRATRSAALEAVQQDIRRLVHSGDLVTIKLEEHGVSELAGSFADDPTLREICADAYRERDSEPLL
jgi:hypothetical protein